MSFQDVKVGAALKLRDALMSAARGYESVGLEPSEDETRCGRH